MIVIHKTSQEYGVSFPTLHHYAQVGDTPFIARNCDTRILDCNAWLWYKGCHTGTMYAKQKEFQPHYTIIPTGIDIDNLAFTDAIESKVVVHTHRSNIDKVVKSYYTDILLIEAPLLTFVQRTYPNISKPVWVNIPHNAENVMADVIRASSFDFVTHVISDAVYVFSSLGVVFHNFKGIMVSVAYDHFVTGEAQDFRTVLLYNKLVFEAWCEGLSFKSFDDFLKGGSI